jgi:polar amino acid transport system ATP-binding protein
MISIRRLHKRFTVSDGVVAAIKSLDLEVTEGELFVIVGASGSGKTTLLRCVNLLEDFDGGEIVLDGVAIGYITIGGRRRRVAERELARQRAMTGMVFQSFNLLARMKRTSANEQMWNAITLKCLDVRTRYVGCVVTQTSKQQTDVARFNR